MYSYCYMCVPILLYVCRYEDEDTYVLLYILILLYVCPHTRVNARFPFV
jgi:hypothetical protein